jgi:hypothetical protein
MEKEFDHEITVKVSDILPYFEGEEFGSSGGGDLTTTLDQAQGDAKTKGVAQRILLVIEPDEEAEEADEEEGA